MLLKIRQRKADIFASRPNLKRMADNSSWLFLDKIIRMSFGLVIGVLLARYLGPKQFGQLNYATALVTLLTPIATLGLNEIVVRDFIKESSYKDELMGTTFFMKLMGGIITFIISLIATHLLNPGDRIINVLVGITAAAVIFQCADNITFFFQSQLQSKYIVLAKGSSFIVTSFLKIILIIIGASIISFAWAGFLEYLLSAVALFFFYKVYSGRLTSWRVEYPLFKRLLSDSWPLILSSISIMIYMRINQIMLQTMVGSRELGIYSVAVRLVEVWYMLPAIILPSVYPSIIEARKISDNLFHERIQSAYSLMVLVSYLIALPTTFLSKYIVIILFGSEYSSAASMLTIFIWSLVFTNLGIVRSYYLMAINQTKIHFIISLIACLLNITLSILWIPKYGGMGAVISSCISYWFQAHGSCFLFKSLRGTGLMMTKAMIYPRIYVREKR